MRIATIGFCLLLAACGPGPVSPGVSDVVLAMQRIQPCVESQAETFLDALDDLSDTVQLLLSQESFTVETAGITPTSAPKVWNFEFGPLSGTATFSHDPSNPIAPGDSVSLMWSYDTGAASGSGLFDLALTSPTTIDVVGSGTFVDGDCTMDIDIDDRDPLIIDLTSVRSLQVRTGGLAVVGNIAIRVSLPPDLFTATLVIPAQGEISTAQSRLNGDSIDVNITIGRTPNPSVQDWVGVWRVEWRCVKIASEWPEGARLFPNDPRSELVGQYDPSFGIEDCNIAYDQERHRVERDSEGKGIVDANGDPVYILDAAGNRIYDPTGALQIGADGFPIIHLDSNGNKVPSTDDDGHSIWVFDPRCIFGEGVLMISLNATDPNKLDVAEFGTGIPRLDYTMVPNGATATVPVSWTDAAGVANEETDTWTNEGNGRWLTKTGVLRLMDASGNVFETIPCEGRARYLRPK